MTYEEAIKILHPDTTFTALAEVEYYGGFNGQEAKIKAVEEACLLACKALEKQIPKKPTRTNGGLSIAKKDFYTKCQLCNHNIPGVVRDARMRFCPFCGQKIDWSDDE